MSGDRSDFVFGSPHVQCTPMGRTCVSLTKAREMCTRETLPGLFHVVVHEEAGAGVVQKDTGERVVVGLRPSSRTRDGKPNVNGRNSLDSVALLHTRYFILPLFFARAIRMFLCTRRNGETTYKIRHAGPFRMTHERWSNRHPAYPSAYALWGVHAGELT